MKDWWKTEFFFVRLQIQITKAFHTIFCLCFSAENLIKLSHTSMLIEQIFLLRFCIRCVMTFSNTTSVWNQKLYKRTLASRLINRFDGKVSILITSLGRLRETDRHHRNSKIFHHQIRNDSERSNKSVITKILTQKHGLISMNQLFHFGRLREKRSWKVENRNPFAQTVAR